MRALDLRPGRRLSGSSQGGPQSCRSSRKSLQPTPRSSEGRRRDSGGRHRLGVAWHRLRGTSRHCSEHRSYLRSRYSSTRSTGAGGWDRWHKKRVQGLVVQPTKQPLLFLELLHRDAHLIGHARVGVECRQPAMQSFVALVNLFLSYTPKLRAGRQEGCQLLCLIRREGRHTAQLRCETVRVSEQLASSTEQCLCRERWDLHFEDGKQALHQPHDGLLNLHGQTWLPQVLLQIRSQLKHCMWRKSSQLSFSTRQLAFEFLMLALQQAQSQNLVRNVSDLLMVHR
mmetsp:Transcript_49790/g.117074  ORF Transcript_49790/g.117074 Transcript_49790/m.117074 type:complete len:284 (-) Transcript_49790:360-1211(-)